MTGNFYKSFLTTKYFFLTKLSISHGQNHSAPKED